MDQAQSSATTKKTQSSWTAVAVMEQSKSDATRPDADGFAFSTVVSHHGSSSHRLRQAPRVKFETSSAAAVHDAKSSTAALHKVPVAAGRKLPRQLARGLTLRGELSHLRQLSKKLSKV